jgi:hypothetical protein
MGTPKKYNNPQLFKKELQNIAKQFNFELYQFVDISSFPSELTFTVEGRGIPLLKYQTNKVALTSNCDFALIYDDYIDTVDHVILPSHFLAEYYGKISNKNLYLGSPKYDVNLNQNEIIQKYKLPETKKALVLFPNPSPSPCPTWHPSYPKSIPDDRKFNVQYIIQLLKGWGFYVIVKTRGKHPVNNPELRGNCFLKDFSWFPHSTMELMQVCDLVINFDSTAIKEAVMLGKPVLNFPVRPQIDFYKGRRDGRGFNFLYGYDYCKEVTNVLFTQNDLTQSQMKSACKYLENLVDYLLSQNHQKSFLQAKTEHLFTDEKNVSKNILNTLGKL